MLKQQIKIQDQLSEIGIIPVIKLNNTENAVPLARALIAGGVPAAEITFRAEGAEKAIKTIRENFPEILAGAGTVLTMEQVRAAVGAGATFVVCPGYDEEIVSYCAADDIPVFPGCVTPTEIQMALKHGLNVVKFFPALQYGGLNTIKALAGPFPGVRFIPTGGITLKNLEEYAASRHIAACGGSFMVPESLINGGNWAEITRICAESSKIIKKARGLL